MALFVNYNHNSAANILIFLGFNKNNEQKFLIFAKNAYICRKIDQSFKQSMKKTLFITLGAIIAILGLDLWLSNYLLETAVNPATDIRHNIEGCYQEIYTTYPEMKPWHDKMVANGNWRDTILIGKDGLKRHGVILQHDSLPNGASIMLHGYNDNAVRMMRYAYLHYEILGRNVILPDHFGHGESEGNHIRFAWLDRRDVTGLWIPTAHQLWQDQDIIVEGLSMGGAMCMYTSGEDIPDEMRVVGFIEDCGYTSIWEQLSYQLKDQFGLPAFPLLHTANWLCYMKYGWHFTDGDATLQLAKCKKPMLFIHGNSDTYVPSYMVMTNYEAKTQGYKELWITEGSEHAESIHDHWEEYCQRCQDFINRIKTL